MRTIIDADTPAPFDGAVLTLARQGGADADDSFDAGGTLTLADSQVLLDEGGLTGLVAVGSYVNADGTLTITFNSEATSDRVNAVLQQINYANGSETPPATVTIGYNFDNGSPAPAAGSIIVTINSVNDAPGVENVSPTALFSVGDAAITLSDAITATDSDNTTLVGAIVRFRGAFDGERHQSGRHRHYRRRWGHKQSFAVGSRCGAFQDRWKCAVRESGSPARL